jgi:hypothetical protein
LIIECRFSAFIDAIQLVVAQIIKDFVHDQLGFPNHHGISVFQCFLGQIAGMHATHDYRYAASPEGVGLRIG